MLKNNNAKFAFLYMFSLVALLFVALGAGQVIFQAINKFIADFTAPYGNGFNSSLLKFAISSLIIATPIYFLTMRYLERNLQAGDLDREAPVRRWLIYFILFVSSVVMIVWLMITIGNFLDGDLTSKFILRAITVIVIAGIIFSYYLYDIRRREIKKNNKVILGYLIAALLISVGSLIASFFFVESPAAARARRHDEAVLGHFTQIDSMLSAYYSKNTKLPETLDKAQDSAPYVVLSTLKDPLSGKTYEYKRLDNASYELCADFMTDNRKTTPDESTYTYADRWPHDKGHQCLKQKAIDYTNDQGGPVKSVPVR